MKQRSFGSVVSILKGLNPLEVLEMVGLDDDSTSMVSALFDYIEDNLDDIVDRLDENGLLDLEEDYDEE